MNGFHISGKRLREEDGEAAADLPDKLHSNGAQARQYRGQRVETPSYPGAAYTLLPLCMHRLPIVRHTFSA